MTVDDIALTLHSGLGHKGIAYLLAEMGDSATIYAASESELIERIGLKPEIAKSIFRKTSHRQAEKELRYLKNNGLEAVASTDSEYPVLLRECPDYPHVLYVMGNKEALGGKSLSVVGTRAATPYGKRMCDVLISRISEIQSDTVIVSGLAFGIDANAHRAALDNGLRTVAVIANLLPDVTPSNHKALADHIVREGGAVITELHSQTKQNGSYFIPRNRIIAGMSEGTLVVESPYGGGSLNTAELADSYHRIVMAVPGRVGDRCSDGTNAIIRKRLANMVCSADDIIRELGWDIVTAGRIPAAKEPEPVLSADEKSVLGCFGSGETLNIDALIQRSGIQIGQLTAILLELELCGKVRALPGKIYEAV